MVSENDATWDILGWGAVAVDDVVTLDGFPAPDSKMRVLGRERHGGGLCATALCAASKLGARCAFAGVLGRDELSLFSLRELRKFGVDTSQVLEDSAARPRHATILVDRTQGTRAILSDSANSLPFPPEKIDPQVLAQARVLFLDHTVGPTGAVVAQIAREIGVPIVADIERPEAPHVDEWLPLVSHLIVGIGVAREMTGRESIHDAARELGEGRSLAVVTDGPNGCAACGEETQRQVLALPAFRVEAVDTTGCGDVFHGAYASELARGSSVQTRLRIASAAAAIKARHKGGRGGLPTRKETLTFPNLTGL
jgi:sulfofructose kinase